MNDDPNHGHAGRRNLLRAIVSGGGMFAVSRTLPDQWARPVVEAVTLPAHAQTTPVDGAGPFDGYYVAELVADFGFRDAPGETPRSVLDMFVSPAHAVPLPTACNAATRLQISIRADEANVCVSGPGFAHPGTTGVNTATGALNDIVNIDNSGVDLFNMMVSMDPDLITGGSSCSKSTFIAPLVPGIFNCSPEPLSNTTSNVYLSSPYDGTV